MANKLRNMLRKHHSRCNVSTDLCICWKNKKCDRFSYSPESHSVCKNLRKVFYEIYVLMVQTGMSKLIGLFLQFRHQGGGWGGRRSTWKVKVKIICSVVTGISEPCEVCVNREVVYIPQCGRVWCLCWSHRTRLHTVHYDNVIDQFQLHIRVTFSWRKWPIAKSFLRSLNFCFFTPELF
jgi:hypothetical protein